MKKIFRSMFYKKMLHNENGIALIMVMGVIAILTFLLADFTFETKLNKIKIYNQQDKIQARLNAEAGLNFALAKLRLYQEGRNKIEKDENLKTSFPSSDLESIIIQPFVYPLPISKKANIIQKSAMDEFVKNTLFKGEMSVTFSKVSGFLNPNNLRIQPKNPTGEQDQVQDSEKNISTAESNSETKTLAQPAWVIIEKKMVETFQRLLKDQNDNNEEFHQLYANVDANILVKELKYYVNDKGAFQDSMLSEVEAKFAQKSITPKFAPMSSIDELYLLPSWDDAIVNLIKDHMSIHEVSVIAINELTTEDLKILFPLINNIQIEEFFKYRDGDTDKKIKGKKFRDAEDFKRVMVNELSIATETDYQERITTLKNAGLVIDTSGKLYKVNSRGSMNNAVYNLVAFLDLPIKPPVKKPSPKGKNQQALNENANDEQSLNAEVPPPVEGKAAEKEKSPPVELLPPRVVEVRLE